MVSTWEDNGGTIEVSDSNRIVDLGAEYDLTKESSTVLNYEKAYESEIIPENKVDLISKFDINYKN
jgi:hypothetical protein